VSAERIFGACLILAVSTGGAAAQQSTLDVRVLFASNCGFCHSDGGRAAGKGPQLMNTQRDDEFLRDRIKHGKEGAMPAFDQLFSEADIDAIIKYIHGLEPDR
jgi:mono/diheme cytochrome c family protein